MGEVKERNWGKNPSSAIGRANIDIRARKGEREIILSGMLAIFTESK